MHIRLMGILLCGWLCSCAAVAGPPTFIGDGRDILLQGFHWRADLGVREDSTDQRASWYRVLRQRADEIREAGFTWIWLPPPSDSPAPWGYTPRRWFVLDSQYGTEAELRELIASLRPVRSMCDIVLNHRVAMSRGSLDFADPAFEDNAAAVVADDESRLGTGAPDTGDQTGFGRDLDHTNRSVQIESIRFLRMLREVGFDGWRLDVAKGFAPRYFALYAQRSDAMLAIGECWDGADRIEQWVRGTAIRFGAEEDQTAQPDESAALPAFDFPTRYLLYDAITKRQYHRLATERDGKRIAAGFVGRMPTRAVTFVENHDTEQRRDAEFTRRGSDHRHLPGRSVEIAYAYILTHPGMPCVYWSHLYEWPAETKQMILRLIQLRKQHDLHAGSELRIERATDAMYTAVIDNKVAVRLGEGDWQPGESFEPAPVLQGPGYAVWQTQQRTSNTE